MVIKSGKRGVLYANQVLEKGEGSKEAGHDGREVEKRGGMVESEKTNSLLTISCIDLRDGGKGNGLCFQECPWRLQANAFHAKGRITMQIKALNDTHHYSRVENVKVSSARWIVQQYEEEIKIIDTWKVKSMRSIIRSKKGVIIKGNKMYNNTTH